MLISIVHKFTRCSIRPPPQTKFLGTPMVLKVLFDRCFLVSLMEYGSMASLARASESTDTCEDCFSFKAANRDLQLHGSAELFGSLSSSCKIFAAIIFFIRHAGAQESGYEILVCWSVD